MSFPAPRPVISGKPYPVQQVCGRVPRQLGDFTGDAQVLIDLDGTQYTIYGPGVEVEDGVRLYEKCDDGMGKDIRVWIVRQSSPDGDFMVMHPGIDVPASISGATSTV